MIFLIFAALIAGFFLLMIAGVAGEALLAWPWLEKAAFGIGCAFIVGIGALSARAAKSATPEGK